MTISSTARRAGPFLGNDSATAFAFSFKVFSTSDITVTTADSAAVETTLVLDTDYTVTLNPNQDTSPGGVVTYPISGSALPTGSRLTITGNLPYDQPLDIPAGGNFNPVTIENEFDRIVMQVQQLREVADRSITASVTSSVSGELPVPQAGRLLGWDQSNTAIVNYSIEELTGTAAYATWVYDTFSGTGIRRIFTLQRSPGNIANCDVSVDGQTLVPITDFTVSGSTLTFVTAPRSGAEILVRYGSAAPQGTYAIETERKVATAGQTVVTLTEVTYVPGANNISVYLNGARMSAGIDFTETSSTSITFENALSLNDEVVCVVGNEVSQAVSAQQVGYFAAGTGAVSRDVRSVLRERVSVKDFGAVGDGVTNDTAAIQAAINSVSAAGGIVVIPAGTYLLNSTVQIVASGITLTGTNHQATWIVNGQTNAPAIRFGDGSNTYYRNGVSNLVFGQKAGVTAVSGNCGLKIDKCSNFNIENVQVFQFPNALYDGIILDATTQSYVSQVGSQACTNAGMVLRNQTFDIYLTNGRCDACAYGVDIKDTQGLYFSNWSCYGNSVNGWRITTDGAVEYNQYLFFNNCIGDTSGSHNWNITKLAVGVFTGCWGSTQSSQIANPDSDGFYFSGGVVVDITMSSCIAFANNRHGIHVDYAAKVSINGCIVGSNYKPSAFSGKGPGNGLGSNSGSGICVGASANRIRINGGLTENNQSYGIDVVSGADRVDITGIETRFNVLGAIRNNANGTTHNCKISNVGGYNPYGYLVPPSVPASNTEVENKFGVDAMVYLTGGTVSDVRVGPAGATAGLMASTPCTVMVPAGQSIKLTYSSAPTWQWNGM